MEVSVFELLAAAREIQGTDYVEETGSCAAKGTINRLLI